MGNNEFGIRCEDEEQKAKLEEPVTKENCGEKLVLIQDVTGMSRRGLAKTIGVSESTLRRLEIGENGEGGTLPTEDFMNRLWALSVIGIEKYRKMSNAKKEKISEAVGTTGGVVAGVGGSLAAIGAAGTVSGFSAAGITSGLAAIGGGTMLAGAGVIAAIPVATGLLGFGLVKGIKKICEANNLSSEEINEKWEIRGKE
ncbi:hypothetical protein ES703_17142 [subsurface metagenome]